MYDTFNPILVRFYPEVHSRSDKTRTNFQSHFGLILSDPLCYYEGVFKGLSIPFWSDFIEACEAEDTTRNTSFQSHFGLILSRCGRTREEVTRPRFQSHFGLILSVSDDKKAEEGRPPFNPILV